MLSIQLLPSFRQAIEADGVGLTIIKSSINGDCVTDLDKRIPVMFGEDLRSGCNMK